MNSTEPVRQDSAPTEAPMAGPPQADASPDGVCPDSPPVANHFDASRDAAPDKGDMLSPEEFEQFLNGCVTAAAERDEWKDRCARVAAEYDNFRRRTAREKEQLYTDVQIETVAKFLPLYDNLIRAVASPTGDEAYKQGVELILKALLDTLEKMGVTLVPALGQSFDPAFHEAVMHIEDDTLPENSVAEVFLEGFALGDRVVRFAAVKVAN